MNDTRTITITIDLDDERPITAEWDPAGYPESYHLWIERVDPLDWDGDSFRITDDSGADSESFTTLAAARTALFRLIDDQVMLDIERLADPDDDDTDEAESE